MQGRTIPSPNSNYCLIHLVPLLALTLVVTANSSSRSAAQAAYSGQTAHSHLIQRRNHRGALRRTDYLRQTDLSIRAHKLALI